MALMSCNMFKKQAIGYISGYVLKMITRFIKCSVCYNACLAKNNTSKVDVLHLFQLKQRGPLLMPSKCVSEICITTENAITLLLMRKDLNTLLKQKCLYENIITMVMRQLQIANIFPSLKQHQFEVLSSVSMFDDHILKLYRSIILCYCRIKLFHCVRIVNDTNSTRIRQKLSRLSIFMNH